MACMVCSTPFLHHGYFPVSPGCECSDRICQNCVRMGSLSRCPTCRKTSPMTAVDWETLRSTRNITPVGSCLGCSTSVPSKKLAQHERSCAVYRDWFDAMLCAEIGIRSEELSRKSESAQEFADRLQWQSERIEDLEDISEELSSEVIHERRRNQELRRGLNDILSSIKALLKRDRPPTPPPPPPRQPIMISSDTDVDDSPPPLPQRQRVV